MLALLKEREPRYREISRRIAERKPSTRSTPAPKVTDEDVTGSGDLVEAEVPALSGRPIPPRPRKKGKKR